MEVGKIEYIEVQGFRGISSKRRLVFVQNEGIIGTRKNCHIFHKKRHFKALEA